MLDNGRAAAVALLLYLSMKSESDNVAESKRKCKKINMKAILYKVKPPCSRCPYKLGLMHTVVNPCPQCKENGYKTYARFNKAFTK